MNAHSALVELYIRKKNAFVTYHINANIINLLNYITYLCQSIVK